MSSATKPTARKFLSAAATPSRSSASSSVPASRRQKRTLIQNLLLSVCSLILSFSVLEVAARLLWKGSVQGAHTGIILREKNREIVHEGIIYRTNSLGLRNKEVQLTKPEGVRRVLALGDSFVWGDGLSEEDLVTTKISSLINDAKNQRVEVINAGISGFNTTDEFDQFIRLEPVLDPDLVIVFFFTNDVQFLPEKGAAERRLWSNWRYHIKEKLRSNSRFMAYLYYVYKGKLASKIGVPQFMLSSDFFDLDDSKPGWVASKKGIHNLQSETRQRGIEFLFVMIPTLTTLDENYPYIELREKVTELVRRNGIHYIDLFDVFAPYRPIDLWVSLENTHWNGLATALAANEIVGYISDRGLLD